jgi:beta-galactosidase
MSELNRRVFLLGTASAASLAMIPSFAVSATTSEVGPAYGRFQPFDVGWRFHRGEGQGLEAPGFDDAGWRSVDLPHD